MDTIKEIESIRTDILDTIAKCECGDDCESVVFLKKIAARLAAISSEVPSVPSNTAKLREALEFIKLASDDYEKYGTTKAGALDVIYEKACDALAAPARNCDLPGVDVDKAYDAFYAYVKRVNPSCTLSSPLYTAFDAIKWILNPANESEVGK